MTIDNDKLSEVEFWHKRFMEVAKHDKDLRARIRGLEDERARLAHVLKAAKQVIERYQGDIWGDDWSSLEDAVDDCKDIEPEEK